jgi:hypothetical protein
VKAASIWPCADRLDRAIAALGALAGKASRPPSDVFLELPGDTYSLVLLSSQVECQQAGLAQPDRPIIFCDKLRQAHEFLSARGTAAGPIQDCRGTQFFEIRDPEGNVIEICKEP